MKAKKPDLKQVKVKPSRVRPTVKSVRQRHRQRKSRRMVRARPEKRAISEKLASLQPRAFSQEFIDCACACYMYGVRLETISRQLKVDRTTLLSWVEKNQWIGRDLASLLSDQNENLQEAESDNSKLQIRLDSVKKEKERLESKIAVLNHNVCLAKGEAVTHESLRNKALKDQVNARDKTISDLALAVKVSFSELLEQKWMPWVSKDRIIRLHDELHGILNKLPMAPTA